ncbi:G-type lectin S-receptor-like serine/threonine-protein kinase [Tanacetum coccineum]
MRYSCNLGIGSSNLVWKVITGLQVISGNLYCFSPNVSSSHLPNKRFLFHVCITTIPLCRRHFIVSSTSQECFFVALSPSRHWTRFPSFPESARTTALSPFHNVRAVAHEFKFEWPFEVPHALFDRELGASWTNITFVNNCEFIVWPGIWGTSNFSTTAFELTKGNSISFEAPSGWTTGRIKGRTCCNFDVSGNGSCTTGDCDTGTTGDCGTGEVECNGNFYKLPPATIAESGLNQFQGQDIYDVSLVDGYNLPMLIEPTGGLGS